MNTTKKQTTRFKNARAEYYRKVDAAIAAGKPNDPRLGHPKTVACPRKIEKVCEYPRLQKKKTELAQAETSIFHASRNGKKLRL